MGEAAGGLPAEGWTQLDGSLEGTEYGIRYAECGVWDTVCITTVCPYTLYLIPYTSQPPSLNRREVDLQFSVDHAANGG